MIPVVHLVVLHKLHVERVNVQKSTAHSMKIKDVGADSLYAVSSTLIHISVPSVPLFHVGVVCVSPHRDVTDDRLASLTSGFI